MKLAEALIARADNQKRIAQLRDRLVACAKVQEGDKPSEEPKSLLDEVMGLADETESLILRINRTNSCTRLDERRTVTDAIAERDMLQLRQSIIRKVADSAVVSQNRYSKSEVRFVATVDIASLQKEADRFAMEARRLDAQIQSKNWSVDLVD